MTQGTREPTAQDIIADLREQLRSLGDELAINKTFVTECPLALVAIDVETQLIVLWNKYAVNIFGYTESEAIGKGLELIIPMDMISMIEHVAKMKNFVALGESAKGMGGGREFEALTKSGKRIDIDIRVFPIPMGDLVLVGAAAEDVSELRQAIRELRDANATKKTLQDRLKTKLQESEQEKVRLIEVNSKAKIENLLVKIYAGGLIGTMSLLVIFGIGPMFLNLVQLVPDDMTQTSAIAVQGLLQVIAGQVAGGAGIAFGKSQAENNRTDTKNTTETIYAPADEEPPYYPGNNPSAFPTTYEEP